MLVNGISGTLGIGGAVFGLAMGANKIYGTGRNRGLLEKVKALAPDRIEVFSIESDVTIDTWVKDRTGGRGVDVFVDALGPWRETRDLLAGHRALRRGGKAFNIGAIMGMVGLDLHTMMDEGQGVEGSIWFNAAEGQDMADMSEAGTADLSIFEHHAYPLDTVNEAISGIAVRNGGFSNFVITP